jgi:Tol biopolymer transport system component
VFHGLALAGRIVGPLQSFAFRRCFLVAIVVGSTLAATPVAHAAFPGRNGRIAFAREGNIWTIRPDGSGLRRVTRNGAADSDPAWSSNGRWIAFTRLVGDVQWIYRIRPNGAGLYQVTKGANPSWSPSGRKLAFTYGFFNDRYSDRGLIYTVRRDGTRRRPIEPWLYHCYQAEQNEKPGEDVSCDEDHREPAWSPSGSWIAYVTTDPCHCPYLSLVRPNGSESIDYFPFTDLKVNAYRYRWKPNWSPNGRWLAFTGTSGWDDLVIVRSDGSGLRTVTTMSDLPSGSYIPPAPVPDSLAAWSPNGRWLTFSGGGSIYTVRQDGSHKGLLTQGFAPDWQPIPR